MANNNSATAAPLLLEKTEEVVVVKPCEPTPSEILSFSTIDNDPNLEIVCPTIYVYQSKDAPQSQGQAADDHQEEEDSLASCSVDEVDPACLIKDALSRVLVYYFPLAGKLKRHSDGRLRIKCNGEGVPFLEAKANCNLSSLNYLDGVDVEIAKQLAVNWLTGDEDDGYHPLMLQVTKFSCGGFTIGICLSHSVCDGFGAAQFLHALAELASGHSEPSIKPQWEREKLVGEPTISYPFAPRDTVPFATSPYLPTTDLLHQCLYINSKKLKEFRASLAKEEPSLGEKSKKLRHLGPMCGDRDSGL